MPRASDAVRRARGLALVAVCLLGAPRGGAASALSEVRIDAHPPPAADAAGDRLVRAWPFCPTTRRCVREGDLLWVTMSVAVDTYSARVLDTHQSVRAIVDQAGADLDPLATALRDWFARGGVVSDAERVATVQGLVQAVQYRTDDGTGWTEYPRHPLEMIVDQQGDCDDAALFAGALLRLLGYEPWFVLWRSTSPGGAAGHISTAVGRRGGLAGVHPPAGSSLIERAGADPLLHVEAVGARDGCRHACAPLGWNEWPSSGLTLRHVVRVDAADLDAQLPLEMWRQGESRHPERRLADRRRRSPAEVRPAPVPVADVRDRESVRLRLLGLPEAEVERVLVRRTPPATDASWWLLTSLVGAGLAVVAAGGWARRQRRLKQAARLREERSRQRF